MCVILIFCWRWWAWQSGRRISTAGQAELRLSGFCWDLLCTRVSLLSIMSPRWKNTRDPAQSIQISVFFMHTAGKCPDFLHNVFSSPQTGLEMFWLLVKSVCLFLPQTLLEVVPRSSYKVSSGFVHNSRNGSVDSSSVFLPPSPPSCDMKVGSWTYNVNAIWHIAEMFMIYINVNIFTVNCQHFVHALGWMTSSSVLFVLFGSWQWDEKYSFDR